MSSGNGSDDVRTQVKVVVEDEKGFVERGGERFDTPNPPLPHQDWWWHPCLTDPILTHFLSVATSASSSATRFSSASYVGRLVACDSSMKLKPFSVSQLSSANLVM